MSNDEVVVLDGPFAQLPWPVEEAEALLADKTPWGLEEDEKGPNQTVRLCRLAQSVNGYHRHPIPGIGSWARSVLDDVDGGLDIDALTRAPSKAAMEEARRVPNGWVYVIKGKHAPHEAVPPEAIIGAWKVDGAGTIVGDFIPNPRFSAAAYAKYSTQELLDVLFFFCRADHFSDGAIKAEEPRLRRLLQEVVRRVRSDHPPTFVVPPKAP